MAAAPLRRGLPAVILIALSVSALPVRGIAAAAAMTDGQVAAMSPSAQAGRLQPLRVLANALDAQGRTGSVSTYGGVELDAAADAVEVFTTDPESGRALLATARRRAPDAEWGRVRLRHAAYSRQTLDAAARRILSGPQRAQLRAVSASADGSGLTLSVLPGASPAVIRPVGLGVAVRVRPASATTGKSWADVKWHDSAPFIGGDVLTVNGHGHCTAGLPAIRTADRRPVLITAAHCFTTGQRVYTEGGSTGAFDNGRIGAFVGTVGAPNTEWDAEPLTGTDNNADESDTTGWKPLTSVAYSFVGDFVCHDGAASFYLGHPTPCGIKVTDGDIRFSIGGHLARGVEGIDVRTGWGCHNGDSGGTVFAVEPNNERQARGIVSSGGLDGTPDQKRVDWTEAVDIFHAFGLQLNPRT